MRETTKRNVIPLDRESRGNARVSEKSERDTNKRDFQLDEAFADRGIHTFKSEYKKLSRMIGSDTDFASNKAAYATTRAIQNRCNNAVCR